jgi:hypothetical protein
MLWQRTVEFGLAAARSRCQLNIQLYVRVTSVGAEKKSEDS